MRLREPPASKLETGLAACYYFQKINFIAAMRIEYENKFSDCFKFNAIHQFCSPAMQGLDLSPSQHQAFVIPNRAFSSPAERASFLNLVRDKIQSASSAGDVRP